MNRVIKAKCKSCNDILISERKDPFVRCKCGKSFLDQCRWGDIYRCGGDIEIIERDKS